MSTVFTLVTDKQYFFRAKRTITDLRSRGKWYGPIVVILIDFEIVNTNFLDFYNVETISFPPIDEKNELLNILNNKPFSDTIDNREINKINQWEKLHVFDEYFKKWDRVVFLDAGLRVLCDVNNNILKLDYKNKILAPDDGGNYVFPNLEKTFKTQISCTNQNKILELMLFTNDNDLLEKNYFLNCIWVYDTSILEICSKNEMIKGITAYPMCKTNEMALMNIFLHFKYKLWEPFPVHVGDDPKVLFEWCESNSPNQTNWRDYNFIKYPCTISFEDT